MCAYNYTVCQGIVYIHFTRVGARELLTQEASVLMSVCMNVGDAYVPVHTLLGSY